MRRNVGLQVRAGFEPIVFVVAGGASVLLVEVMA